MKGRDAGVCGGGHLISIGPTVSRSNVRIDEQMQQIRVEEKRIQRNRKYEAVCDQCSFILCRRRRHDRDTRRAEMYAS